MTEYKIVSKECHGLLEKEVNRLLENGWQLRGELVIKKHWVLQALTRTKPL